MDNLFALRNSHAACKQIMCMFIAATIFFLLHYRLRGHKYVLAVNTYMIIYASVPSQINVPLKKQAQWKGWQKALYLFSFIASFYLGIQTYPLVWL